MRLSVLSELISSDSIVSVEEGLGSFQALLTEEMPPGCSILIKGLSEHSFILDLDVFTKISDSEIGTSMFAGTKGERKRADFIIIDPAKKVIVFIELKCGRNKNCDSDLINNQLLGAMCLFGYIKCVLKEFWQLEDFLEDYHQKKICIVATTERRSTAVGIGNVDCLEFKKVYAKEEVHFSKLIH